MIAALLGTLSAPVAAYQPTTALGTLGQSELQQRTGDAVTVVCGGFVNDVGSGNPPAAGSAENDLFDRCGNMVQNANDLLDTGGPTAKSLGLDEDQLPAAVQTVANEELAATKSMTTEIAAGQANSAIARLHSVRAGTRFGIAGLGINSFDAFASMDPRARAEIGSIGGAAGDDLVGDWGFFVNGHYGFGDRDTTDREDGFDFDRWGITGGIDYRISENFVLGGMLSFSSLDSDFDQSPAVPGGGVEADAWGVGIYGTYYRDRFYVDGLIGYNQADYDIERRILLPLGDNPGSAPSAQETNRTARGSTDSDDFTFSLGAGMDFGDGNLSYGPYGRLSYVKADVDGYEERGAFGLNLTVDDQDWESFTSVLGGRIGAAFSQNWGVLVPQARLGWVHEFSNDSETFTAFYTADPRRNTLIAITDDPDRNYFELGVGVSAVMRNNTQAFFDYQTLLDHKYVNDHVFTVGVRSAF